MDNPDSRKIKDERKHIRVILLGGKIVSVENRNGFAAAADLSEYVKTFHELDTNIEVTVKSFKRLSGYETRRSELQVIFKVLLIQPPMNVPEKANNITIPVHF